MTNTTTARLVEAFEVHGIVSTEPNLVNLCGRSLAAFRMKDTERGEWVDVQASEAVARCVGQEVRKGDRVTVHAERTGAHGFDRDHVLRVRAMLVVVA